MFVHQIRANFLALMSFVFASSTAQSNSCVTNVAAQSIPSTTSGVALQSFSYCGGLLDVSAYIENVDFDKVVTLYYTDGSNTSTPRSAVNLSYDSAVDGTNGAWEYWGGSSLVYIDGITELLNLTYRATDVNEVYTQQLSIKVVATGAAIPSPPPPPVPYATPSGLSDDITLWLALTNGSQINIAKLRMLANINPSGAANGTVVASTSVEDPNYHYNWVRDAALTMDVVYDFYAAASDPSAISAYENILFQYAQARAGEQNDPGLMTSLGEPKFFLNNSLFMGPWGRPQNDGPAESAITLMEFANTYLSSDGSIESVRKLIYDSNIYPTTAPVQRDLLYVAANWSSPSFDLWEEESSDHFFNRLVSHRALVMGSELAERLNDSTTSAVLTTAAEAIVASLPRFWDQNRGLILYEYGPVLLNKTSYKDIAVILGVLHGYAGDGQYSYTNDQVLASAYQITTSFLTVYPVANVTTDSSGLTLGIPIGRYPEDIYNGTGTESNGGNPWFLATATMAELFYEAANEFLSNGSIVVTNTSLPFWNYFAPSAGLAAGQTYGNSSTGNSSTGFMTAILALEGWADAFMRRIKYHAPGDGRLAEEFNRNTGVNVGAADLTWSFASVLKAAMARARVSNDTNFARDLANLGYES